MSAIKIFSFQNINFMFLAVNSDQLFHISVMHVDSCFFKIFSLVLYYKWFTIGHMTDVRDCRHFSFYLYCSSCNQHAIFETISCRRESRLKLASHLIIKQLCFLHAIAHFKLSFRSSKWSFA